MGNYWTSLSFRNYGYFSDNNNIVDLASMVHIKQTRFMPNSEYFCLEYGYNVNGVQNGHFLSVRRLQNKCEEDTSIVLKMWTRLVTFFISPFESHTGEHSQFSSSKSPFKRTFKHDYASDVRKFRICCENPWKSEVQADVSEFRTFSEQVSNPILHTKKLQGTHCFAKGTSCVEGITRVDLDSLYFSKLMTILENHCSCILPSEICGTWYPSAQCQKSISFFIDIKNPFEQKPMTEEYRFSVSFSFEQDAMLNHESCEESWDEDDSEDEFVIFEDFCSGKDDDSYCELQQPVTLSGSTSVELLDNCGKLSEVNGEILEFSVPPNSCETCAKEKNWNSCLLLENDALVQEPVGTCERKYTMSPSVSATSNNLKKPFRTFEKNWESASFSDSPDVCNMIKSCCALEENSENNRCESSDKTVCSISRKGKRVSFQRDKDLVIIHQMCHWDFAYRKARKGPWEVAAVDRCRFWQRIQSMEKVIGPCLQEKLQLIKKLATY